MIRRSISILALCALAPAGQASGQDTAPVAAPGAKAPKGNGAAMTSPVTPSNPRSIAQPAMVTLTIRYLAVQGQHVTVTSSAGAPACTPPPTGFQVGLPTFVCTLGVKTGQQVILQAHWAGASGGVPAVVGEGPAISGKEWAGDCAGTTGATCTLGMNADRTVTIIPGKS